MLKGISKKQTYKEEILYMCCVRVGVCVCVCMCVCVSYMTYGPIKCLNNIFPWPQALFLGLANNNSLQVFI
jgi:tetrahydromethanopterin S-methyltransferase subunit H